MFFFSVMHSCIQYNTHNKGFFCQYPYQYLYFRSQPNSSATPLYSATTSIFIPPSPLVSLLTLLLCNLGNLYMQLPFILQQLVAILSLSQLWQNIKKVISLTSLSYTSHPLSFPPFLFTLLRSPTRTRNTTCAINKSFPIVVLQDMTQGCDTILGLFLPPYAAELGWGDGEFTAVGEGELTPRPVV